MSPPYTTLDNSSRTRTLAKEKLKELQDQYRELEEHMLAVCAEVVDQTIHMPTITPRWVKACAIS